MQIKQLEYLDINQSFLDCLSQLKPVGLTVEEAEDIFYDVDSEVYIVIDDGIVVGTASLYIEQKLIHGGGRVAHVEDFVVSSYFRGMGVDSFINRSISSLPTK